MCNIRENSKTQNMFLRCLYSNCLEFYSEYRNVIQPNRQRAIGLHFFCLVYWYFIHSTKLFKW